MKEPLFTPENKWLKDTIRDGDPASRIWAEDRAALNRAINLSIESAFTYGKDMPVGAVALRKGSIIGRGFANDRRLGNAILHAEQMAILDSKFGGMNGRPDTIVTSLEPCTKCQDFLAQEPEIKRVVFGISRTEVAAMGLVNPATEDVFERTAGEGYDYEVSRVDDEQLHNIGLTVLRYVSRSPESQEVAIDTARLEEALTVLRNS